MSDSLPPIVPRSLRTRVAVPMAPPVLKPSLIPYDVLRDIEREERLARVETDADPTTSPTPAEDDGAPALLSSTQADLEVAVFALSQVAQLKLLPTASLEAVASGCHQVEIPDGEALFCEGDAAESFYVVVDGTLEIKRQKEGREVALRHIGRGEALGLFGLFSGQQRAATARAIGDCTVIEVHGDQLQALLESDDALHGRFLAFYRERLLEGFMANTLFSDIDSIARARLIGRFEHLELEPKQSVMEPGEVTNLLAVVTHGRLVLEERAKPGQAPKHFEVTQGNFVVVTAAMTGVPTRLRIFAPEYATVSTLSQRTLNELLKDYPALRAMSKRLPQVARQLDTTVFCAATGVPGL